MRCNVKTTYKGWTTKQVEAVKNNKMAEGKTYAQCAYFARVYLHKGFRPVKGIIAKSRDIKGKRFYAMHERGKSYTEIAKKYGLTRQRIHAVIQQYLNASKVDA